MATNVSDILAQTYRLKHREFNFHSFTEELGYRKPIPIFSGPYITHEPDIQVYELAPEDKFVILASDGLWNNCPRKHAGKLVTEALEESKDTETVATNPGQKIISR